MIDKIKLISNNYTINMESQSKKEELVESGYRDALRRLLSLPPGEHKELRYEIGNYERQLSPEVTSRIMSEVTEELEQKNK